MSKSGRDYPLSAPTAGRTLDYAAGAGVLGRELVGILFQKGLKASAPEVRNREFKGIRDKLAKTFCADVTKPVTLKGICKDIDMVISAIGITRMNGSIAHQAVDFREKA